MRRVRFEDFATVAEVCFNKKLFGTVLLIVAGVFTSVGFGQQGSSKIDAAKLAMFAPLPDAIPATSTATEDQINLGRMLFPIPGLAR